MSACASSGTAGTRNSRSRNPDGSAPANGSTSASTRASGRRCKGRSASLGLARDARWSVLDAGCGQGHFARFYSQEYPVGGLRRHRHFRARSRPSAQLHPRGRVPRRGSVPMGRPGRACVRRRPEPRGPASDSRRRRRDARACRAGQPAASRAGRCWSRPRFPTRRCSRAITFGYRSRSFWESATARRSGCESRRAADVLLAAERRPREQIPAVRDDAARS